MNKFNIGDRVRIKDRQDWPAPGYRMANQEGTVVKRIHREKLEEPAAFGEIVDVQMDKTEGAGLIFPPTYPPSQEETFILAFHEDDLEKIS